ncbi:hypothetical protein PIB30_022930 [Stylosanthes scabra]|uniref:Uncharacterized protein n=1 Tax=Stylosanthes scabra TaxID=79078 RepID=A0ABU6Q8Y0_9FABA|nr:hypothetical protein [Stylosanthes scabra]
MAGWHGFTKTLHSATDSIEMENGAKSDSKLKFSAPYLDVPVRAPVGDRTTPLISDTEVVAFAERMVDDVDLELVEEKSVDQPPLKPPDLKSHTVVLRNADDATEVQGGSRTMDGEAVDQTIVSDAEVGASARGKWTGAVAIATNGGLRARQLRWLVLLTQPPLLAAVLPWNRSGNGEEWSSDCWQWSAEAEYSAKEANQVQRCFEEI